jgi:segregation and condensation protein B
VTTPDDSQTGATTSSEAHQARSAPDPGQPETHVPAPQPGQAGAEAAAPEAEDVPSTADDPDQSESGDAVSAAPEPTELDQADPVTAASIPVTTDSDEPEPGTEVAGSDTPSDAGAQGEAAEGTTPTVAVAEPKGAKTAARSRKKPKAKAGSDPVLPGLPGADQAEDDDAGSGLPDLTEDEALHSALEALLLVVDSPAEVEPLADALEQPVRRIRAALKTMAAQYHEQNRGIDLRDVGGGWRFYTRDRFAPFVEKLLLDGQRAKLTRAALESLAVIAYRQPVTRARVAAVRGVNVDGVIRTLFARGLIEETGTDKDTGGILYRTTELFLERLGLASLEDLPPIAPLLPEVDAIDDV